MEELWNLVLYNFVGCLLVFARISGIFVFNPILGRQNVPMRIRVAMAIAFAVCTLAGMGSTTGFIPQGVPSFVFILLSEAFIGLVFGFFVNMIMTILLYAGHSTDAQIGLMMANIMDPATGIQMPVFATVYTYMFVLYFFLTDSHLSYIRLFTSSYGIIPIGFQFTINTLAMVQNIVLFFGTIMTLAMKLALPVISAGLIVEICVGVMMKAVPSIQVFVVNIQLKILLGFLVIFSLARPISDFIDGLFDIMWVNLDSLLNRFV
ncbi:MAG: flagellar biosynthetic protein FliR [Oscillospiraceae bacterium]|nr:flagellar biosynthetic protein FliR [Oscillospiraceae bacterium]